MTRAPGKASIAPSTSSGTERVETDGRPKRQRAEALPSRRSSRPATPSPSYRSRQRRKVRSLMPRISAASAWLTLLPAAVDVLEVHPSQSLQHLRPPHPPLRAGRDDPTGQIACYEDRSYPMSPTPGTTSYLHPSAFRLYWKHGRKKRDRGVGWAGPGASAARLPAPGPRGAGRPACWPGRRTLRRTGLDYVLAPRAARARRPSPLAPRPASHHLRRRPRGHPPAARVPDRGLLPGAPGDMRLRSRRKAA